MRLISKPTLFSCFVCLLSLSACSSESSDNNTNNVVVNNSNNQNNANNQNNVLNNANNQNNANNANNQNNVADAGSDAAADATLDTGPPNPLQNWCPVNDPATFSFFVTSMAALWTLSESDLNDLTGGFGGDFGGIAGADQICQTIADATGAGDKTWRAFLSATDDGNGNPVHAIERIGDGPWYDANGRLIADDTDGLLNDRPDGEAQAVLDLADECGIPLSVLGNAHDIPTGSNRQGMLNDTDLESTCNDWTSSSDTVGVSNGGGPFGPVRNGHSYPRNGPTGNGAHWMSDHALRGCGKGANLENNGSGSGTCIGCTGGYGAIYCFAE